MKLEYFGAKFYSKNDMSMGWSLEKAEKVINDFNRENTRYHINYILELYNICLLFDTDVKLKKWSDDDYTRLKSVVKNFRPLIGRFFSEIDYLKLKSYYPEISIHYIDDFWEIFENLKVYERISSEEFLNILEEFHVPIHFILKHKILVQHFDIEISTIMKKAESTAEILISYHLARKEENSKKYYIPASLSIEQQIKIIEQYVDRDDANPNYLLLISKSRSTPDFPISDEIRLKSKRRHDSNMEKLFESGTGFSFGATIGFSNSDEVIDASLEDVFNPKIIYSRLWLQENTDNPTLLNNFIYLFGYVDSHIRSTFPSNKNHFGTIERFIGVKGNREYEIGTFFKLQDTISSMQIRAYYYELLKLDIRLESVFKWFFEEYLNNEFQAEGFALSIPSQESSFLEKMRTMCSELDSILKHFTTFVNNGEIDRELIEISRNTPLIEDIPSFFAKKYGYIVDTELLNISHLLFSDQSRLAYVENKKEYNNFIDIVDCENIKLSDFFEYQIPNIKWLIEKNVIYEEDDGYIRPNLEVVLLLKDFYQNDVISLSYYRNNELLANLISKNKVICKSKLFSKPEQNYLNFILNDRTFDNGPAIRNKYSHGNNPQTSEEHENDYFHLLKIIALIIIKINEEFCLRDKLIKA